jgi:hypothetical protein
LQREDLLTIEILMQTVVIARSVVEEERRGPGLPGTMTADEKCGMLVRISHIDIQGGVPAVSHAGQGRIQRMAQFRHQIGQGISKILVFTASEAVACHHDPTSEQLV